MKDPSTQAQPWAQPWAQTGLPRASPRQGVTPSFIDSLCFSPSCHAALWGARLHLLPTLFPMPGMLLCASCPSWTSPGSASSPSRSKAPAPLCQWSSYTFSQFARCFLYCAAKIRHRSALKPSPCLCSILFLPYTLSKRFGVQKCVLLFLFLCYLCYMCMC